MTELTANLVHGIPATTHEQIIASLHEFDEHKRQSPEWIGWQDKLIHKYAISFEGRLYPVKEIIRMATGFTGGFAGGYQANSYIQKHGFEIVNLRSDESVAFWWVNQGTTYEDERAGGYIWLPQKGSDGRSLAFYTNLTKVKPGDIIIHYARAAIRSVSEVQEAAVEAPRPRGSSDGTTGEAGYLVHVSYADLNAPIPLAKIPEGWRLAAGGPFNSVGAVNQGYLYPVPREFVAQLAGTFSDRLPDFVSDAVDDTNSPPPDAKLPSVGDNGLTPTALPLDASRLDTLIERFKRKYGSFSSDAYCRDERDYKVAAAQKLRRLLGQNELKQLLDDGQFEAVRTRIKQAAYGNNMLNQWDIRPILDADPETLAVALFELLYRGVPFAQHFTAWVAALKEVKTGCWPAATYYLMLFDPTLHLFVKPTPYRELLQALGNPLPWESDPSAAYYFRLQALGVALLEALKPLGARDMIDVQSFIWVVHSDSMPEPDDDEPQLSDESSGTMISRAQWQQRAASNTQNEFVRKWVFDYPAWLETTFGDSIAPRDYGKSSELSVFIHGQRVQLTAYNKVMGMYVLMELTPQELAVLQQALSRPFTIKQRAWGGIDGWRFFVDTDADYELLKELTKRAFERALQETREDSMLPSTLGNKLRPYVELVARLDARPYTAQEIVDALGRLSPPIAQLDRRPNADQLARDLTLLRLLQPLPDGRFQRWAHLGDTNVAHMLRYAALTLVAPDGAGGYMLPILDARFDSVPHGASEWRRAAAYLPWYAEAGLATETGSGMWQGAEDALTPLPDSTATAQAINIFLDNLRLVKESTFNLSSVDGPLPQLAPETLNARIAEIQRELLIDHNTIVRIYRSLVAGHHVILSGPPGTGKTHLARRLPEVLWREESHVLRLPADPTRSPTEAPLDVQRTRRGYAADVVTATEDWGVRHVIGGIMPTLDQNADGRKLIYKVVHGCLTRSVLANYGLRGDELADSGDYEREEVVTNGATYRGQWLVIDEFTRAPIDAAFGSLLTTLGGQSDATLSVPTNSGADVPVPLPRDFRLIGTLNSFDRHFLNQMSEALKRRFTFIDILPPSRRQAENERGIAAYRAFQRLQENRLPNVLVDDDRGWVNWDALVQVQRVEDGENEGAVRYRLTAVEDVDLKPFLDFWRFFQAARVYRQFGTAQAESVYTALVSGRIAGMTWEEALDTALADVLADQLQVLNRDEQRVLQAYIEYAANPAEFYKEVTGRILKNLPMPRQQAHLMRLKLADPNPEGDPIDGDDAGKLTPVQLGRLFVLGQPLLLPSDGLFARQLAGFINERGL